MNYYEGSIPERMKTIIAELENTVNLLYSVPCVYARNILLYQLKAKIADINLLSDMMYSQRNQLKSSTVELLQQNRRDFTLRELAIFNGRDGNNAYVAVNGVVYDVTNNAAWAAASHFGLTAGKDLTREFSSCHAGNTILSKLKVVGKLV